ncbi:hypothetical protein ACS0TY_023153 [Phlomoides rotata]
MDAGTADPTNGILQNRNERGRRGWSLREEQVLSAAMKRIQVLPNTDLKPEPHINSRITVWKKNYHSIFEMLKHTGVGLDSTTYMVDATDEQWDAFIKRDLNARHMRHKSWPLYADWCEIFGQSRATGGSAQSHLNARIPLPGSSASTDTSEVKVKLRDGKNYKQWSEMQVALTSDPFVDVVHNFCNTTSDRLGEIAQRIGHDQDMSTARKSIYSSVSKMDTLTLQEKLRATALIARHAEDIDVFFYLPDDDQKE